MIPNITPGHKRVSSNIPKRVIAAGNIRQRIKPMVHDRMYIKLEEGGQVQVRYATEDPRVMLFEGEG